MRYNQIITEFLDMNVYGAWLNVRTGKSYPIMEPMGHSRWIRDNMHKVSELQPYADELEAKLKALTPEQIDDFEDDALIYETAYQAGFIKTMHPSTFNDFNIVLGGKKTDLAKALKYVSKDLKHAVGKLYLYIYNGMNNRENEMIYKLPSQLADAIRYINH